LIIIENGFKAEAIPIKEVLVFVGIEVSVSTGKAWSSNEVFTIKPLSRESLYLSDSHLPVIEGKVE
jgi:hypothetical protein